MRKTLAAAALAAAALAVAALAPAPAAAGTAPPTESPPTSTVAFSQSAMAPGDTRTVTVTITNPSSNSQTLTGLSFTDTLPAGLTVSDPNPPANFCAGTASVDVSNTSFSLSGGYVSPNSSCSVSVLVTATQTGVYTDGPVTVSSNEGGSANSSSDTLTVAAPPTIAAGFVQTEVPQNDPVTLSFNLANPNNDQSALAIDLAGVGFSDSLPVGLVIAPSPKPQDTCGGTVIANPGSSTLTLRGARLGSSFGDPTVDYQCIVSVDVVPTATGTPQTATGPISAFNGAIQGVASNSTSLIVDAPTTPPAIAQSFASSSAMQGQPASVTFTLSNPNSATSLADAGFTDSLPAGLRVTAPNSASGTCLSSRSGVLSASPGSGSISLTRVLLASKQSCSLTVNVTGTAAGDLTNTTGGVFASDNSGSQPATLTGNSASATLRVIGPPALSEAFSPASIQQGDTSSLTFTVANPNLRTDLSVVDWSATLSSGLTATGRPVGGTCSGETVTNGTSSFAVSGLTLPAGSSCTVILALSGAGTGKQQVTATAPSSNEGGSGQASTASLDVSAPTPPPVYISPVLGETFSAQQIESLQTSTLSFTIRNPTASQSLSGVGFTDHLPTGLLLVRPATIAGGCGGGTVSLLGPRTITLSGAVLPAGGSCTFSVRVLAERSGTWRNDVIATSDQAGNSNTASASIQVSAAESFITNISTSRGKVSFDLALPSAGTVYVLETAWTFDEVSRSKSDRAFKGPLQPAAHRFVFARQTLRPAAGGLRHVTILPGLLGRWLVAHHDNPVLIRLWVSYVPTGGEQVDFGFQGILAAF